MSQGCWIDSFSKEYNMVFNNITSILGSRRSISKLEVWKIDNPLMTAKFQQRYAASLQVNSWLNTKEIFAGTEDEILSSIHGGFGFPEETNGMKFVTGKLSGLDSSDALNFNEVHGFVMCVLAVGRSFVVPNDQNLIIPSSFDSLVIEEPSKKSTGSGARQYYINNSNRLCPTYYIRLQISKDKNQAMYHRLLAAADTTPQIAQKFEYFNFNTNSFITSKQKSVIRNENELSAIVPLQEAVRQFITLDSVQNMEEVDDAVERLESLLDIIEDKTRAINVNYSHEFERITELAKKAQAALLSHTKKHLDSLKSADVEIHRQLSCLNALESDRRRIRGLIASSMTTTPSLSESVEFINSWQAYSVLKSTLANYRGPEMTAVSNVHVDFTVKGEFDIVEGSNSLTSSAMKQQRNTHTSAGNVLTSLEKLLLLQSDDNMGSIYASDGAPSESIISNEKQVLLDEVGLSIQQELKRLQKQAHEGPPGSRKSPAIATMDFPVPASIAVAYGGVGGRSTNSSGFHRYSVDHHEDNDSGSLNSSTNNPCEAFNNSFRNMLQVNDKSSIHHHLSSPVTAKSNSIIASPNAPSTSVLSRSNTGFTTASSTASVSASGSKSLASTHGSVFNKTFGQISSNSMFGENNGNNNGVPFNSNNGLKNVPATGVVLSMEQLILTVNPLHPQYSLRTAGQRKKQQLSAVVQRQVEGRLFASSGILHPEEAEAVFYSLPFFGSKIPTPTLNYSTQLHTRSLDELYKRNRNNQSPSVLIIQSGEYVFGVYLSHPVSDDSMSTGSPSCYIFSVTFDLKINFHGKNPTKMHTSGGGFGVFVGSENKLEIGNKDLCILNTGRTLNAGSCDLEGCFGVGWNRNSVEAKCLLAGTPNFTIDILEQWIIQ